MTPRHRDMAEQLNAFARWAQGFERRMLRTMAQILYCPAPIRSQFTPPPHDCSDGLAPFAEPGRYELWTRTRARYAILLVA